MGYAVIRHDMFCLRLACTDRYPPPLRRRRITQETADVNDRQAYRLACS